MTQINFQSNFLQNCQTRGFIYQGTNNDALDKNLSIAEQNSTPLTCYIGFDCTAPSLHIGSLIQIMMLRHFQQAGHKPIILMGGGTTKIGDPSGKDKSRTMIDEATINKNMAGIKQVFEKFLKFGDGRSDALMVNNDDWLRDINYVDFLRDYGRHFSVNRMMSMESVKQRLEREQPLSFLEFNYMIMQAYDFTELYKKYNCTLQIGGSDQWGNIIGGVELNRRVLAANNNADIKNNNNEIFGLTTPLLTTSTGAKMGKTADGAIWLDENMISPYDYWQFWRNVEDADTVKFLKLFTELPIVEIDRLAELKDAEINEAKKTLATEATALLHGRKNATLAEKTATQVFEQGQSSSSLPTIEVQAAELTGEVPAFKIMQLSSLANSGGEARRLIRGGGAKINDQAIKDENELINFTDIESNGAIKISAGKKRHVLLKIL